MARLSDIIEEFIKNMLDNAEERELQIQRNELANYFSCAPSQINYVLTTRFTTDKGYYVESKRGGGGYIVIKYMNIDGSKYLVDNINDKIGDSITFHSSLQIIDNLVGRNIISEKEGHLIKVAVNDRTLYLCGEMKNRVRADILKNMLIVLLL
ncbi:CtsR family transcriptional regulator [uncultured Clostridium sp.]|uniref:CtsR family transcriptional regulator n=1 Tax=uncultured Clostridium sp. TaxID=59620 RepID=UPI0028E9FDAA|nr:CtsR family transcriptional regulator [uncultured Clostridium sp.]